MTFAPEWFTGNVNLSNKFLHVYVYLFFMNFVWVLVPAILLYDSFVVITRACDIAKVDEEEEMPSGKAWSDVINWTLVLYAVLVPSVLLYAMGREEPIELPCALTGKLMEGQQLCILNGS